jgi:hypothetical protein
MKFDYPGGVANEEAPMIERFESDVIPYLQKHGSLIGDLAMKGDPVAETAIRSYRMFVQGVPEMRAFNYALLVKSLKAMEVRRGKQ